MGARKTECAAISTGTGGRFRRTACACLWAALVVWFPSDAVSARDASLAAETKPPRLNLLTFAPRTTDELVRILDAIWAVPREPGAIPNVAPTSFPKGMGLLPATVKKRVFLRSIAPYVVAANLWIDYERRYLLGVGEQGADPHDLDPLKRACLAGMAERYRLAPAGGVQDLAGEQVRELIRRVDVIPVGLALAQAAIESAWGASRFTRAGNSLFGQWVFSAEKGMAPRERPEGADYAVAKFDDLAQSVAAYLYNLNTFWAYEELRALRETMRDRGLPLDSPRLADGLMLYSERRGAYVDEVRAVMRVNGLAGFDRAVFSRRSQSAWTAELERRGWAAELEPAGLVAPFADPSVTWSKTRGGDWAPLVPGSDG